MPIHIDSPRCRILHTLPLKVTSVLLNAINIDRAGTTPRSKRLSPHGKAYSTSLQEDFLSGTSNEAKKLAFSLVYEPSSIIHCHATLPSFR